MKVLELTNLLLHLDPDMIVVISGYEGGLTEIVSAEEKRVNGKNKEWWLGEYKETTSEDQNGIKTLRLIGKRS
jgi:hypothetical protein